MHPRLHTYMLHAETASAGTICAALTPCCADVCCILHIVFRLFQLHLLL